jgi:hypothetical protein
MADSIEQGHKKKKKRKEAVHLLEQGSPEFSELGDVSSARDAPIHIQFSAKEPSAEDKRFADVIRFKYACEAEMKMYGDDPEFNDEKRAAKKDWIKANHLYKQLLQKRSAVLGEADASVVQEVLPSSQTNNQYYHSALEKRAKPRKRKSIVDDDEDDSPKASTSSRLQDGLYCEPHDDVDLEPEVREAIRKIQEQAEEDEEYSV